MTSKRVSKNVSEIMAAILLTLIAVSLGAVFLLNYLEQSRKQEQVLEGLVDRMADLAAEPLFDILYTYYNTTPGQERLEMAIYVGPGVLEVVGIYVNDTLVWNTGDPNAYVNGTLVTGALLLGGEAIYNLTIAGPLPLAAGDTFVLKVAISTGTQETALGEAH